MLNRTLRRDLVGCEGSVREGGVPARTSDNDGEGDKDTWQARSEAKGTEIAAEGTEEFLNQRMGIEEACPKCGRPEVAAPAAKSVNDHRSGNAGAGSGA